MRRFAAAWRAAVEAPGPAAAEAALADYLRKAPPVDAAWAVWFLAGKRCGVSVPAAYLRRWALEESGLPEWLFEESRRAVGNLPETVAHLLGGGPSRDWPLHRLAAERLAALAGVGAAQRRQLVVATWRELAADEIDLWNRLLGGVLRPRPALAGVARAVATVIGGEPTGVEERLAGDWSPSPAALEQLAAASPAGPRPGAPLFSPPAGEAPDSPPTDSGRETAGHTFTAVLLYAQRSDGGRGSVYSELTLGVWRGGELVPVAKLEASLSTGEALELDRWVRRNNVARFGPVRQVRPELVFEVGCEAVRPSARHKSGLTLRAPRLLRWRRDAAAGDAATLASLRERVDGQDSGPSEA